VSEKNPPITRLEDLPAQPRRIILHWTAGGPEANATDLSAYHYVVEQSGVVREGVPVRRNLRDLRGLPTSEYAAHTRGLNSYSVGVSLAGMHGASEGGPYGRWPITEDQTRAACAWVARLCETWGLEVTQETVFSHWEAEHLHGVAQAGKWDITVFPWDPAALPHETGPTLREWVRREEGGLAKDLDLPTLELTPPQVPVRTPTQPPLWRRAVDRVRQLAGV
jgi:N-acetyl-anhydromuramyl-L-alanine amidase AmpD